VSGLFLSFEGGEAAGKSVQAARLAESLGVGRRDVVLTREPGGTPFAERIRDVLLHAREVDLTPETQALLFSAARAQHTRDVIRPALAATPIEDANAEWVEIMADLSSDFANWRLQHLRGLWKPEVAKPIEWEWIYTWGSPSFVRAGEIYRIHSGSRARAATHPLADDLAPGRKHVYAAGPIGAARLIWKKGDYVRLVDAFGTVIDEVVVWPEEKPAEAKPVEARTSR